MNIILALTLFQVLSLFSPDLRAQELISEETPSMSQAETAEAKKMLENPEQFNKEIKDITKGHLSFAGVTGEMVKFYTAVALVESKNCFLHKDPTSCEMFWESMKDPMGHVGFISFMVAANKSTEAALYLTKGKLPKIVASNIGLMIGMMVQDVLVEFIKNPLTKELANLPFDKSYKTTADRLKRAGEIKNALWKQTFGNRMWRDEKAIQGISLLSAVALSSATQHVMARTAVGMVQLTTGLASNGSKAAQIGLRMGKAVWMGGRAVRLFSPIGLAITGVVIFLEWSGFTEKYIAHPMRLANALQYKLESQKLLEIAIQNKDKEKIKKYSDEVSQNYFRLRGTILEEAMQIHAGHEKKLEDISKSFYKTTEYMEWLAKGSNMDVYYKNEGEWHRKRLLDDVYYDLGRYQDGFFCGPQPKNALRIQRDLSGLPIPFQSFHIDDFTTELLKEDPYSKPYLNLRGIEIRPYQSLWLDGLCDYHIKELNKEAFEKGAPGKWDMINCPINHNSRGYIHGSFWLPQNVCRFYQKGYRGEILREGKFQGQNIRRKLVSAHLTALKTLIEKYEKLRLAYIKRYEMRIYPALLEGLTGQEVELGESFYKNERGISTRVSYDDDVDSGDFIITANVKYSSDQRAFIQERIELELGAIPNLREEITFWNKMIEGNRGQAWEEDLKKAKEMADKQLEYAGKLQDFNEMNYSDRKRETDFDMLFGDEDWIAMAKFYQNFILN